MGCCLLIVKLETTHAAVQMIIYYLFFIDSYQLGMHITAIRRFIKDHPRAKAEHLTTSQLNSAAVKPESFCSGNPYIPKYLDLCDSKTGKPLVAPATVFVSHAWRYSFYDVVVDAMEQHAK